MKKHFLILAAFCLLSSPSIAQQADLEKYGKEIAPYVLLPDTLQMFTPIQSTTGYTSYGYMVMPAKPESYQKTIPELNVWLTGEGELIWKKGSEYLIWSLSNKYSYILEEFKLVSKEDSLFMIRYRDEISGSGPGKSMEYLEVWQVKQTPVRVAKLVTSFTVNGVSSLDQPAGYSENSSYNRKVKINEEEMIVGEGELNTEVLQVKEGSDKKDRSANKEKISPAYAYVFKYGRFIHKIRPPRE